MEQKKVRAARGDKPLIEIDARPVTRAKTRANRCQSERADATL